MGNIDYNFFIYKLYIIDYSLVNFILIYWSNLMERKIGKSIGNFFYMIYYMISKSYSVMFRFCVGE